VFVMAHKFRVRRFNQDPSILGRTFVLSGKPMLLVGIMPERFHKNAADLWMVRPMDRARNTDWNLQAKLKPGVTVEQARADLDVIVRRLAKQFPERYPENYSVKIVR
jgi:putative ABC transport system permease protein